MKKLNKRLRKLIKEAEALGCTVKVSLHPPGEREAFIEDLAKEAGVEPNHGSYEDARWARLYDEKVVVFKANSNG